MLSAAIAYASILFLVPVVCSFIAAFLASAVEVLVRGDVTDAQASRVMRQLSLRDATPELLTCALLTAAGYHMIVGRTGLAQVGLAVSAASALFLAVYGPAHVGFLRDRPTASAKPRLQKLQGDDLRGARRLMELAYRFHLQLSPEMHRCRATRLRFLSRAAFVFLVSSGNVLGLGTSLGDVMLRVILALIPPWFMRRALEGDEQFTLAAQRRTNRWALRQRQFAVLYLRAFDFDRSARRDEDEISGFSTSDEQDIVSALASAGAVVALGDPRRSNIVRGAIRLSIQSDDWQAHVRGLLGRVRLVVVVASTSHAVLWEVREAAKLGPDRLLVLVPASMTSDEYRAFRSAVSPLLAQPLPVSVPTPSALMFDGAWSPKVLAGSRWLRSWHDILAPVVRRLRREAPTESPHQPRPRRWQLYLEFLLMIGLATLALIVTRFASGVSLMLP